MQDYGSIHPTLVQIFKRSSLPVWIRKEWIAEHHELIVVIRGGLHVMIDGAAHTVKAGEGAYVPIGVRRYAERNNNVPLLFYACHFTCKIDGEEALRLPLPAGRVSIETNRVLGLFKLMHFAFTEDTPCTALVTRAYLQLILAAFLSGKPENAHSVSTNPHVVRVKLHIHRHPDEKITAGTIKNITGLNPDYFSHLFKKETGCTIHQYLVRSRISRAKELMAAKKQKIADIAEQCGFDDALYFTKVFRKVTGMSPSEFMSQI